MIRPWIGRGLAAGAVLGTLATAGHADAPPAKAPAVVVRSGNHSGFGRVVLNTTDKTSYQLDQDGDQILVSLTGDVTLGTAPLPPRNVLAIETHGSSVELTLSHGATVRAVRWGGAVVLDFMDPQNSANPQPGARPNPPAPEPRGTAPQTAAVPSKVAAPSAPVAPPAPAAALGKPGSQPAQLAAAPHAPLTTASEPAQRPAQPNASPPSTASASAPIVRQAAQQTPPGRDVLPENAMPAGLMAQRAKLPPEMNGSAFRVPFDSSTGAAAFNRGDTTYIIFAERRPIDMSALRADPIFSATTVRLLPEGTLFRVPLPPGRWIALTPLPRGWRIAALTTALKQQPITGTFQEGRLSLAVEQPAGVLSLADPDTGATLLVGTQRRPGQGVVLARRSSEFILQPTIQGVVVEPLSDAITFKQTPTGFSLAGGAGGLLLSSPTALSGELQDAAHLTQRLNFSTLPPDALRQRAARQIANAAEAPPLARGLKNRQAAESLLALGLGAEAESLFRMAAEQDPREAASADTGAMTAIAALLAGRKEEADALLDPRLDGSDDISLWRAVRQAMQDDGSPGAAAMFSATAPLVFEYPKSIRDHILPLMVETMIKGGEIAPAARLLDQERNEPKLAYARALMRQKEGDTGQALSMMDALANGRDQFDRARAATDAVELRLAAGKLDQGQAADVLDKLLYAWRGDAREVALRERIADLRSETGAWRAALGILRQAEADFPEQAKPIHERLKDMFAKMIRDPREEQVSPIDFVSMVEDNTDLLGAASDDDEAVQQALANRLLALDLPSRAKPVLEKLMVSARTDLAKARFGASLATLDAREGDEASARTALDRSEGHELPPDLAEQRMILRANSVARLGNPADGAAMLAPLRTARATEARAQILENAADWTGAKQAWSDCVAMTLPDSGTLNEAQMQMLLRLATATARAGDDAGLAGLRAKYTVRLGTGPLADMFRLLTTEPVKTSADIKRSHQDVSLAASLPGDLKALQGDGSRP